MYVYLWKVVQHVLQYMCSTLGRWAVKVCSTSMFCETSESDEAGGHTEKHESMHELVTLKLYNTTPKWNPKYIHVTKMERVPWGRIFQGRGTPESEWRRHLRQRCTRSPSILSGNRIASHGPVLPAKSSEDPETSRSVRERRTALNTKNWSTSCYCINYRKCTFSTVALCILANRGFMLF